MSAAIAIPPLLKRTASRLVAAAAPQCGFDRALFVLGHMRCGSTALSRVLGAHPQISGWGEAHIAYRDRAALGQLLLAQSRRGLWKPGARYLHDKILHNRYDEAVPGDFGQARAIFLVRPPEPAIRSIRHLFGAIGSSEYASDATAADYYEARLERLAALWPRFAPDRRVAVDFAELTARPEAVLARLSAVLGLATPLANSYAAAAMPHHGAGDPLTAPHLFAITPAVARQCLADAAGSLYLPPGRLIRLHGAYCAMRLVLFGSNSSKPSS